MTCRNLVATACAIATSLAMSGCVTAPKPLLGEYSRLKPTEASQQKPTGARVRWGGRIVQTHPQAAQTCFEIVGIPTDGQARPIAADRSDGRFLACRGGFYDPEVFKPGREVTITGTLDGFDAGHIGDYAYDYPRVAADVVYLWPERKDIDVIVERPLFVW